MIKREPGEARLFDPRVHEPPDWMTEPWRSRWAGFERGRAWSARTTIIGACVTVAAAANLWWPW
jgi:hypothetical protein